MILAVANAIYSIATCSHLFKLVKIKSQSNKILNTDKEVYKLTVS